MFAIKHDVAVNDVVVDDCILHVRKKKKKRFSCE
jgi:hypothetical protein